MRCSISKSDSLWDIRSKRGHWALIKAHTLWHLVQVIGQWPYRLYIAEGDNPDQLIQEYLP